MNDSEREKTVGEIHQISNLTEKAKALGEEAVALHQEYCDRYGQLSVPENVPFLEALWKKAGENGVLQVFQAAVEEEVGEPIPDFEKTLYDRLLGLAKGESLPAKPPVSIEPFSYVWREQNRLQSLTRAGNEVDFGRLNRILAFLRSYLGEVPASETRAARVGKTTEILAAIEDHWGVLPPSTGQTDFELKEKIAEGAHGVVWRAHHATLGIDVAVKFIKDLPADNEEEKQRALDRFLQEARTQFSLRHPNIVLVHNASRSGNEIHIVQELVEGGRTIEHLLAEKGALSAHELILIARPLASALGFAESQGVLHRDIKPSNILLTPDGAPKLTDFGIAKHLHGPTKLTVTGTMIGTPLYMSPEQVQGRRLTHKSDQFSFGALLYHMATGAPPFTQDPEEEEADEGRERDPGEPDPFWRLRDAIVQSDPDPIPDIIPSFDASLWSTIKRCLEKDPARRFETFAELERALGGSNESHPAPIRGRWRRAPLLAGVLIAVALVLLALSAPWEKSQEGPSSTRDENLESAATAGKETEDKSPGPVPRPPVPEKVIVPRDVGKGTPGAADALEAGKPPKAEGASGKTEKSPEKGNAPPSHVPGASEVKSGAPPTEPSGTRPPAPLRSLRQRLLSHLPRPEEQAAVLDLMTLFGEHRIALRDRRTEPLAKAVHSFGAGGKSAPSGSAYVRDLVAAAREVVSLAGKARESRWKALLKSQESVRIERLDGSSVAGRVKNLTPGTLMMEGEDANVFPLAYAEIAPGEFLGGHAPPRAELACRGLLLEPGRGVDGIFQNDESSDDTLLWVPFFVRLARLEIVDVVASVVEVHRRTPTPDPEKLDRLQEIGRQARILERREPEILKLYPYLGPEFDETRREEEALKLLLGRSYGDVLARFDRTSAFPVAAELLMEDFLAELKAGHDELISDTAWYDWGWRLIPREKELSVRLKYWKPDPVKKTHTLISRQEPRGLAMEDSVPHASKGVLLRLRFTSHDPGDSGSSWQFHLLNEAGDRVKAHVNEEAIALYGAVEGPGKTAPLLSKAPLPTREAPDSTFRTFVLLPAGGYLHFFCDGRLLMSVSAKDASIPKHLALNVIRGSVTIRNIQVRKAN